jgi:hypothetical protein
MEDRNRPPALWPFLLLCATVAVWIDFGSLHAEQHADALIQILASLQAWKPFFWEQDRYGSLVALLASPIRDPLANLLVQNAVTVFMGLAAPFLLARYLFRDAIYALVGAISVAAFVALAPPLYRFEFFVDGGYGVPFSLAFAALLMLEPNSEGRISWIRRLLACVLAILAHWVFLAAILTLAPLVVLRSLTNTKGTRDGRSRLFRVLRPDLESILSLVVLLIGLAGGWAIKFFVNDPWIEPTMMTTAPRVRWMFAWEQMLKNNWSVQDPNHFWLLALGFGALAGVAVALTRRRSAEVALACIAPAAAALSAFLFMGTRLWVEFNQYDYRYSMPSLLFLQMAAFAPMLSVLREWLAVAWIRRAAYLLSSVVVFGAAWVSYGPPSSAGVRAHLDERLGEHSHDAVAANCTHIAGDYWFVWRTVYHANLLKAEQGLPGQVWGIALRGHPTWSRWRDMPPSAMRIGVEPGHLSDAEEWCEKFGLPPLELVEKRPKLWIYKCKDKN